MASTLFSQGVTIASTWLNDVNTFVYGRGINAQTGTAYTTVANDANRKITTNNAAANTVTIQAGLYQIENIISVIQLGAGQTTIVAGAGVTLRSSTSTFATRTQYSMVTAICIDVNTWLLVGDLA